MTQSPFTTHLTVLLIIGTQLTHAAQPEDTSRRFMHIPVYFSNPDTGSPAFISTIRVNNVTYADVGDQLRKTYNIEGELMCHSLDCNNIFSIEWSFNGVPYPYPQLSFVARPRRIFNSTKKIHRHQKLVPMPSQSHT